MRKVGIDRPEVVTHGTEILVLRWLSCDSCPAMVVGLAHRGVEHLGEHSCRMMSVRRGMLDGMVDAMAWGLAEKLLLLSQRPCVTSRELVVGPTHRGVQKIAELPHGFPRLPRLPSEVAIEAPLIGSNARCHSVTSVTILQSWRPRSATMTSIRHHDLDPPP